LFNMILERVLCLLCANKTFKNSHSLHIHHSAIHITKKISAYKANDHITCTLCPKKKYKSTKGLRQHETLRHLYYNTPASNLLDLPQQHIDRIKETLFDWGTQKYQHGQETQVVLVGKLFKESLKQMQPQKTKDKCNKKDTSQLTIEWKRKTIIDNTNNKSFSG
ncbi:1771_t:CDS:2, partial [Scutellospora calospora]